VLESEVLGERKAASPPCPLSEKREGGKAKDALRVRK